MPVYIIRAGVNGPVKIGFAEDVSLRLNKMQADNHEQLIVLRIFVGGYTEEATLHQRFDVLRLHGEWFSFSREMLGDLGLTEIKSKPPELPSPPAPLEVVIQTETDFSGWFRSNRKALGLTQEQLATRLGVVRATIAGIETGEDQPGRNLLLSMARIAPDRTLPG